MQKSPHSDLAPACPLCRGVRKLRDGSYCWTCKRAIHELQGFTRKEINTIIMKGVIDVLRAKAALQ